MLFDLGDELRDALADVLGKLQRAISHEIDESVSFLFELKTSLSC